MLVTLAAPFVKMGEPMAHSAIQRAVTLPEKDVKKLASGMSAEDNEEALRLRTAMADAISDFVVFVSSRGSIKAD